MSMFRLVCVGSGIFLQETTYDPEARGMWGYFYVRIYLATGYGKAQ